MLGLNIKLLRKRVGKSQEEVANSLGLNRSSYSGYENGVAEPSIATLIQICTYFKISVDFLLKNDFTTFTVLDWQSMEEKANIDLSGQKIRILNTIVNDQEEDLIELIPQKARAGYSMGYSDPDYLKVLPTFSLPFLSKNKKYRSFPIMGDSMPPVSDGSYVVAEYIQNWMQIKNGTPCIVVTKEDGIVFKIVYNQLSDTQSFLLCSTNPMYNPYAVKAVDVIEMWKFVNYIASDMPDIKIDESDISKSLQEMKRELSEIKSALNRN